MIMIQMLYITNSNESVIQTVECAILGQSFRISIMLKKLYIVQKDGTLFMVESKKNAFSTFMAKERFGLGILMAISLMNKNACILAF